MIIDLTKVDAVDLKSVGGKAYNLHRLARLGMPVPWAIVVHSDISASRSAEQSFIDELYEHPVLQSRGLFAVRSSGVGEDGVAHSFAGIFDSFLDIPRSEVSQAVLRVKNSIVNTRSSMYSHEKATAITAMGVVVQRMVAADYAGVAFSASPVEGDSRIALLEIVEGLGENLVSGQKTPATLRINKITGTFRVQQQGEDRITEEVLEEISQLIMPLVLRIEKAYGIGVDVEWAVAGGKAYILQARPITT